MRRWLVVIVFAAALARSSSASPEQPVDPHAEMAAALAVRADTQPAAAVLPGTIALPTRTALPIAPARPQLGKHAAERAQVAREQTANALAHAAETAAMAVAGQAQAQEAKQRAMMHPHK